VCRYVLATVMILASFQAVAAEHPTALELLDKYAETQDKLQRSFVIHSEVSTVYSGVVFGGAKRANNEKEWYSCQLRYDGTRYFESIKRWGAGSPITGPIPKEAPHYASTLWDGRFRSSYSMDPRKAPDNDELDIEPPGREFSVRRMIAHSSTAHELLGFLYGDYERVDTVLRHTANVSVRDTRELVAGSECYVIEAAGRGGTYTLWIDPEHGYNIARATVQKGENAVPYGQSHWRVRSASNVVDNVQFKLIGKVWVPVEADIKLAREWHNDEWTNQTWHVKRTKVVLDPDHEVLRSFVRNDVRNGATVEIADPTGKRTYTWWDGQVVDSQGCVMFLIEE